MARDEGRPAKGPGGWKADAAACAWATMISDPTGSPGRSDRRHLDVQPVHLPRDVAGAGWGNTNGLNS